MIICLARMALNLWRSAFQTNPSLFGLFNRRKLVRGLADKRLVDKTLVLVVLFLPLHAAPCIYEARCFQMIQNIDLVKIC